MQKASFFTVILLFYMLLLSGCNTTKQALSPFQVRKSTLAMEENPEVSNQALQTLSQANNLLSFDLYSAKENNVYSAYSLFGLLNMLSSGANAQTKTQILHTLHQSKESHPAFNALHKKLMQHSDNFHVQSTNALWLQEGFDVKKPFLDTLALHYGLGVYLLDFQKDTSKSTQIINDWIAEKTKNTIPKLLAENAINTQTKLILTNALYLKGDWVHKFPQQRTLFKNFTLLDNTLTQVQTMHQENNFLYSELNHTKILSMPYLHSDYALLSIMPPEGEFAHFSETFNPQIFSIMIENLTPTKLNLYYPRYTFSSKRNFINPLKNHGMVDAFTQSADFSGISDQALYISQIIQQTTISVDENGTEAAAATSISIGTTSIPTQPALEVKFDHPFLFALYHIPTKTILFYGQMLNPSNQ